MKSVKRLLALVMALLLTLNMVAGYADAVAGDPAALQVSAPDERTFVVNISGHCSYFLSVVCTAVCTMPVRSDVAEPAAQEGENSGDGSPADAAPQPDWSMDADTLLTNGPYTVGGMDDKGLTATAAERYYDARRIGPQELDFLYTGSTEEAMSLYCAGRRQC